MFTIYSLTEFCMPSYNGSSVIATKQRAESNSRASVIKIFYIIHIYSLDKYYPIFKVHYHTYFGTYKKANLAALASFEQVPAHAMLELLIAVGN